MGDYTYPTLPLGLNKLLAVRFWRSPSYQVARYICKAHHLAVGGDTHMAVEALLHGGGLGAVHSAHV